MKYHLLAILAPLALSGCADADPTSMQPGLWEITTEMDMPGMPIKMPPTTLQHCYTAEELAQGKNTPPQGGNDNCTVSDYQVKGDTATWRIECTGAAPMQGTGTMTTTATTYTGSMKSVMGGPGGGMEMTTHWNAKRLGDCR